MSGVARVLIVVVSGLLAFGLYPVSVSCMTTTTPLHFEAETECRVNLEAEDAERDRRSSPERLWLPQLVSWSVVATEGLQADPHVPRRTTGLFDDAASVVTRQTRSGGTGVRVNPS